MLRYEQPHDHAACTYEDDGELMKEGACSGCDEHHHESRVRAEEEREEAAYWRWYDSQEQAGKNRRRGID